MFVFIDKLNTRLTLREKIGSYSSLMILFLVMQSSLFSVIIGVFQNIKNPAEKDMKYEIDNGI